MSRKYVFISGAAGGIGKAITTILANEYHIIAADRNFDELNKLPSDGITKLELDLSDIKSVKNVATSVKQLTNGLHGLINLAGIFDQFPLVEVSASRFIDLIQINFVGQQHLVNELFPLLYRFKGRIINLSSETVLAQMPLQSYGFSKKLFDTWSSQLRIELALLGINVITIRAGGHQTPFIKQSIEVLRNPNPDSLYANLYKKIEDVSTKILKKQQGDPAQLAKKVKGVLTVRKPKNIYYVNVSILFRLLSIIPPKIREFLILHRIKRWM